MKNRAIMFAAIVLSLVAAIAGARAQTNDATKQLARDIYMQLVEINTTDSVGSTTVAAEAMARRLSDAGFPASDIYVGGPNSRKGNLVARLHGTGAHEPILLIGHLDVVEARREDWSMDPFQLIEKDGYFYGRGSMDMKSGDTFLLMAMIRMKQEGYKPDRDIILALTADEEGGAFNGVDWLIQKHRDLVDADYVL
ncbi:MAG TPA: M20/M25/M40 family metallo-hydrolase, partial [Candidatus Nanoarchaeia archaeon]|nr:M20/M25/M40 family metallo-hydrolase [Candidatus Nanoarchaeia archaeon]